MPPPGYWSCVVASQCDKQFIVNKHVFLHFRIFYGYKRTEMTQGIHEIDHAIMPFAKNVVEKTYQNAC